MSIENLPVFCRPKLSQREFGAHEDPGLPILSFGWSTEGAHRIEGHSHARGQLIFQEQGTYRVNTQDKSFVVSPQQAAWIPPHAFHGVYNTAATHSWMFFVDPTAIGELPDQSTIFKVEPLLRELLRRVVTVGNEYQEDIPHLELVRLALRELAQSPVAEFHLPLARDPRIRTVMDALLSDPGSSKGLDRFAVEARSSERTLSRLFKDEIGLSFSEWRKQLRLLEAIDRIGQGQPVKAVARDLGYSDASAFIAMFRKTLKVSPAQYVSAGNRVREASFFAGS